MIHYNAATQTFNLLLKTSYYAFQVNSDKRLVHLGWGVHPEGAGSMAMVSGKTSYKSYVSLASFETQLQPDEILTYGDVTNYHVTLRVTFPSLPEVVADFEADHLPIRDVRLRYVSHEIVTDAQPGLAPQHGLPTKNDSPRETLRVLLQDPVQPFAVTLCYRLTPEHDIIERWCELENFGSESITIEVCNFASLHLPNGTNELTSVSGAWAREFTSQRNHLPMGTHILESHTLQTGHATNPFFLMNRPGQAWEESGTVFFGQLAYSGSWRIAIEQLPSWDVRVHAGYNPFDFELILEPGERHVTSALISGVCPDGWGGASRRLHMFARERVLPHRNEPRPVLYNSWEATLFDVNFANQAVLAHKAAAIGVELFCVDDGWFGSRRSDKAGLGDWTVSTEAFPDGLEPLIAEVHRLGMKFGLWVEPEMINPDSDLYRQHPDWILHFAGRPRTEARHQLVLDFGRQEVVDHILTTLERLVTQYDIAFMKWDMNRYASEPGSVVGKAIWRKHVAGVYHMMDTLRRKHPDLMIQSCSGGGGRIDLGILGRTDQVWVSDNTDAFDRIRIQEGFSLVYPARSMEAWVTDEHNFITHRNAPLSLRFDVAMRGVLGIGTDLSELDETQLADYASYIAFYKQIRHVIQEGQLYRLERLEEFGSSVVQYVLPNGEEAVYSVVIRDYQVGRFRPIVPLRGLTAVANYIVLDRHHQEFHRATGYELMTMGIPRASTEHVGYSTTLYVKQIK